MPLQLTRKPGESIVIAVDGEEIARITVYEVLTNQGKRAKLSLEGDDVAFWRDEIWDKMED